MTSTAKKCINEGTTINIKFYTVLGLEENQSSKPYSPVYQPDLVELIEFLFCIYLFIFKQFINYILTIINGFVGTLYIATLNLEIRA